MCRSTASHSSQSDDSSSGINFKIACSAGGGEHRAVRYTYKFAKCVFRLGSARINREWKVCESARGALLPLYIYENGRKAALCVVCVVCGQLRGDWWGDQAPPPPRAGGRGGAYVHAMHLPSTPWGHMWPTRRGANRTCPPINICIALSHTARNKICV